MKKFHFPLVRVREWREKQVALEEVRLERLMAERTALDARRVAFTRERQAEDDAVLKAPSTDAMSLCALEEYRAFSRRRMAALDRERIGCESRVVAQRSVVLEAQRKVRLLEKLESRRRQAWNVAFERELDEQAAESHRSRRHMESTR